MTKREKQIGIIGGFLGLVIVGFLLGRNEQTRVSAFILGGTGVAGGATLAVIRSRKKSKVYQVK